MNNIRKTYPQYFLVPALILYMIFFIIPSLAGIGFALTDWNAYRTNINFVGLNNFKEIFITDPRNRKMLYNTLVFALVTTFFKVIFGLLLALLLNYNLKTKNLLRTIFYLPVVFSPLIIGLIFTFIFHPKVGLLNQLLRFVGLDILTRSWLVNLKTAMPAVMSVEIWRVSGFCMVIFIAGMQLIPQNLYESSDIDGADGFQKFIHITLPFLRHSFTINIILNIIWGLKVFDIIFVLTKGGPAYRTDVINTAVYNEYAMGRYGIATALGAVMFIFTTLISFILLKILTQKEVDFV